MLSRFLSLVLAVLALSASPCLAQTTSGSLLGSGGASLTFTPPIEASGAGYNTLTFATNVFTTSNFDATATQNPGYQWYQADCVGTIPDPTNTFINSDGTLSVGDPSAMSLHPGLNVSTVTCTSGSPCPTCWHGTAFGGGLYVEGLLKFNISSTGTGTGDWPAFWGISLERRTGQDQWPGQATGYKDYPEVDFPEYFQGGFSQPNVNLNWGAHNWYGASNGASDVLALSSSIPWPGGFDPSTVWHKYGLLWIPATASTCGFIKYYLDDVQQAYFGWTQYNSGAAPPPAGAGCPPSSPITSTMSILDAQHLFLYLDGPNTNRLQVKQVHVWQVDARNNLTN